MRQHFWARDFTHYLIMVRHGMQHGSLRFSYDMSDPDSINCLSFTIKGAEVLTGCTYPEAYTGYTDAASAFRRIRSLGAKDLPGVLSKYFPEKSCAHVHRGDIVLVPGDGDELFPFAAALAEPPHFWGVSRVGMGHGNLSDIVQAFAVESHHEDGNGNKIGVGDFL